MSSQYCQQPGQRHGRTSSSILRDRNAEHVHHPPIPTYAPAHPPFTFELDLHRGLHPPNDHDVHPPAESPTSEIAASSYSSGGGGNGGQLTNMIQPSSLQRPTHDIQPRSSGHPQTRLETWSRELWLHPNITGVVEELLAKFSNHFSYSKAWLMMQIMDLQIGYQLSRRPLQDTASSENSKKKKPKKIKIPPNCLLPATPALNIARTFSRRHISHHIPPDCWLEREIQLRVLVSTLSLLCLLDLDSPGRPSLSGKLADELKDNINSLSVDLHNGKGSAHDKGDCEFLIRYAINLLGCLPGDESKFIAVASRGVNLLFAAGVAYQYQGQQVVEHLRAAFRPIAIKPSAWHAEIDYYHHLTMSLLSISRYGADRKARPMFRDLSLELIGALRSKLRDGFATVNDRPKAPAFWGKLATRATDLIGTEPADNPTHLTYGLMYLLCRLVERLVAQGDGKDRNMDELIGLLVTVCQKSKFEEVTYKAHEILFQASINPHYDLQSTLGRVLQPRPTGRESSAKREAKNAELQETWNQTMSKLKKRQKWVENRLNSSSREDEELVRDLRGDEQPCLVFETEDDTHADETGASRSKMQPLTDEGNEETRSPTFPATPAATTVSEQFDKFRVDLANKFAKRLAKLIPDSLEEGEPSGAGGHHHLSNSNVRRPAESSPIPASPARSTTTQPIAIIRSPPRSRSGATIGVSSSSPGNGSSLFPSPPNHQSGQHHSPSQHYCYSSPSSSPGQVRRAETVNSHYSNSSQQSSHTLGSTSNIPQAWQEDPTPFPIDNFTVQSTSKLKLKGSPDGAYLSASCKTVAFLSRSKVDVYGVPLPEAGSTGAGTPTNKELDHRLTHVYEPSKSGPPKEAKEYVHAAVTDQFVVLITRDRIEVVDIATRKSTIKLFSPTDSQRLCTVAASSPNESDGTTIAVAYIKPNHGCVIQLYNVVAGPLTPQLSATRTLLPSSSTTSPEHWEVHHLRFSPSGSVLVCVADTHGSIGTWDLQNSPPGSSSAHSTILPSLPVNDGRGGMDGITSTVPFPSMRYLLSTTGSTDSSGAIFISARTRSRSRPPDLQIPRPAGPIMTGAVSPGDNAVAVVTSSGKVWVAELEAQNSGMGKGFSAKHAVEVGGTKGVMGADLAFLPDESRRVLVAAFVGHSGAVGWGSTYGQVVVFDFPED